MFRSVIHLDSTLDLMTAVERSRFESGFPLSRREGAIIWDKCILPDMIELSRIVFVSAFVGSSMVTLTAYINNMRLTCDTTMDELLKMEVMIK